MILWIFAAVCIVLTIYVVSVRVLPLRLMLGYATVIDVVFTAGMLMLFHGSVTGLMAATLAGLIMALSLSAGRWLIGYQRLALRRHKLGFYVDIAEHPGKWQESVIGITNLVMSCVNYSRVKQHD